MLRAAQNAKHYSLFYRSKRMLRAAQNADHAEVERRALQGNDGAAVYTTGADFSSEREKVRTLARMNAALYPATDYAQGSLNYLSEVFAAGANLDFDHAGNSRDWSLDEKARRQQATSRVSAWHAAALGRNALDGLEILCLCAPRVDRVRESI